MTNLSSTKTDAISSQETGGASFKGMTDNPFIDFGRVILYGAALAVLFGFWLKGTYAVTTHLLIATALFLFSLIWSLLVKFHILSISRMPLMWYLFPAIDVVGVTFFASLMGGVLSPAIVAYPLQTAGSSLHPRRNYGLFSSACSLVACATLGVIEKARLAPFQNILGYSALPTTLSVIVSSSFVGLTCILASVIVNHTGTITVTKTTRDIARVCLDFEYLGKVEVKGKGELDLYTLIGLKKQYQENGSPIAPNDSFWNSYHTLQGEGRWSFAQ